MNTKKNKKHKHNISHKKRKTDLSKLQLTTTQNKTFCSNFDNPDLMSFEEEIPQLYKKHYNINILSTKIDLEKFTYKNLKQAVSSSKITPKNDFYSYINERWLQNFRPDKTQKYIVQFDDFRLVQDKVYHQLIDIIKEYTSKNNTKFSKCLKNFYNSAMNHKITLKQVQEYSQKKLKEIDDIRLEKNNLWVLLGFLNETEIVGWGSPFVWFLNPDDKDPHTFRCFIEGPQLSLVDLNIYLNDNEDIEYKKNYKKQYFKYLKLVFEYSFGKDNKFNVEHIFNCEVKLFNAFNCTKIEKEDPNNYNLVIVKDALSKYNFNWSEFSKALGFKKTPHFFITSNLNYLYCMTNLLLQEWDNEEWRTYYIYLFIRQQQRYCNDTYKNFVNFQGKFSRGLESSVDKELTAVFPIGYAFNTFLTREYEKKYRNERLINYVKIMAEDLKTVFIRIIKRNKWLQPSTKQKAIKKLEHFKFTLSSPKELREDPILNYSDDNIWENLLKISEWRHNQLLELEGKKAIDIPIIDWASIPPKFIGTQAYVVNAAYTPSENGIYIPLGYIQKPFVDLEERGIEYNLAHIGFTLAHEMSHALDDWGSKYDEIGVLNDWWTEKDKKMFKKIQNNVIKQYEEFAAYDGITYDAEPSIGEDLADISGLSICRDYLRDFQLKNEDILPIKKISYDAFFIYFAFQQRQKLSKKALENQLKTNPHPPDKYRCNIPLSRLPIFRIIYNVKKGDKMWWSSTNRVWED